MSQMKKKRIKLQINEMKSNNLPDAEFKTQVIRMLKDLREEYRSSV